MGHAAEKMRKCQKRVHQLPPDSCSAQLSWTDLAHVLTHRLAQERQHKQTCIGQTKETSSMPPQTRKRKKTFSFASANCKSGEQRLRQLFGHANLMSQPWDIICIHDPPDRLLLFGVVDRLKCG